MVKKNISCSFSLNAHINGNEVAFWWMNEIKWDLRKMNDINSTWMRANDMYTKKWQQMIFGHVYFQGLMRNDWELTKNEHGIIPHDC